MPPKFAQSIIIVQLDLIKDTTKAELNPVNLSLTFHIQETLVKSTQQNTRSIVQGSLTRLPYLTLV